MKVLLIVIASMLLAGCAMQPIGDLPGSYELQMPERCSLWIFTEESDVKEFAVALACPGIDLLRLFPWPPVQPWGAEPSWELAPELPDMPKPVTLVPDKSVI